MDRWRDFPLPDGAYADDTRPWTQQDVVNYLPTFAELPGSRSRLKLACAPGLRTFASIGTGPHRGARDVEGKLFVVSGNKLYQVSVGGVATELGTIPGTARVSMTHNQVAGGNQLLIGTGSNSYVWDTSDSTLTANGVPLSSVDFLNQLNLGVDSQRRFWRYSALADATDWNTLDNESAESSPDRIVGGIVSQGEWLVFGERTIEVWQNNPTDATAFQRGTVIEKGCANANTICRLDNTVYFLGNDLIVYRLNGYTPVPVSTKAQAAAFRDCDPAKAFAFTYEDRGYVVYYLSFQDGMTWGFDVTSQRSHRRESFGLSRWRLNTLVKWNGEWYGGDYSNGNLYQLEWGFAYEGCELMPRKIRSGVMHGDGNPLRIHALKVLVNTGGEESAVSGLVPTISSAMPDGYVGEAVSYQLTITTAFPGQDYTITASGLPTGLSVSGSGLVTGTLTTEGTFTPTYTVTTDCGTATASDTVVVGTLPSVAYDVAGVPYKFMYSTDPDINTDFSPVAYDDSAWATGQGGFGFSTPEGMQTVHTPTDRGFDSRIWLRQTVAMAAGRDCRVEIWRDDGCQFWWNGVQYSVDPTADYYRVTVTIPGASVTGNDLAALRVTDGRNDSGGLSGSDGIYASMHFQSL